ncbi:MAG: MarR family transcriptional regulator [Thermoguttaceae bacterium]
MNHSVKVEEAVAIASLLPAIMRQLFTLDNDLAVDLPLAQLRVCISLQEGPLPMSALSRELGVTLSAMTQIADRLERANLVSRVAEEKDRRVRCLQLTPRAEKIMRRHEDSRIRSVSAAINHLPPDERKGILAALETLMMASIAVKNEKMANGNSSDGSRHQRGELLLSKVIS